MTAAPTDTDAAIAAPADGWTATELGHVQNAMRPSEMTYERAREIVGAICNRSFLAMGLPQHPEGDLAGVSLIDMLTATALVEVHNRRQGPSLDVLPDPRLIAAAFALENYEPAARAIVASSKDMHFARVLAVMPQTIEADE